MDIEPMTTVIEMREKQKKQTRKMSQFFRWNQYIKHKNQQKHQNNKKNSQKTKVIISYEVTDFSRTKSFTYIYISSPPTKNESETKYNDVIKNKLRFEHLRLVTVTTGKGGKQRLVVKSSHKDFTPLLRLKSLRH